MVFETLVADLLNRYLGTYLETLNASQLRMGIMSGNVSLENVDVRATAFDNFDIPMRVVHGHVRRLTLSIPFKNLYTKPVIAELDGLYILAVPRTGVKYDEQKERQYKRETKRKTLSTIESMKEERAIDKSGSQDSFFEKLAAQIIKNVQVKIENIHVRFEDSTTISGITFSTGITLKRLAFQTSGTSGEPITLSGNSSKEFFKNCELDSLAIYWNHNSKMFSSQATGPLRNIMNTSIASSERISKRINYILRPISFNALLHVHMQPEQVNFLVPQIAVDIKFEEIEMALEHNQYVDLVLLLDSIDRLILQNKFWKYKSLVKSKNYPNASTTRWIFAYTAVVEEIVRRRSKMWSWPYIKRHRQMIRDYTGLWTRYLLKETFSSADQSQLDLFEDELDVMNLMLARQRAEIQASKRKATKSGGGWFAWLTGGSSSAAPAAPDCPGAGNVVLQRVQQEMTPEEKRKLYSALDYTEGVGRSSFPPDYVSVSVRFSLGGISLTLLNNELRTPTILKVHLNAVTSSFKQRSGDNAVDFTMQLAGFEVLGTRNVMTDVVPTLISSTATSNEALLEVEFAKNPLDRSADQRLHVSAAPLEAIYDADTINKIVDFFKLPTGLRLNEISSSVMPSLDEMKAMTTTGLRHLVSTRTYLDLQINIQPSYFLLPEHGCYTKGCRLIMVDFGCVSLRSIRAQLDIPRRDDEEDEATSTRSISDELESEATSLTSSKNTTASPTPTVSSGLGRKLANDRYKQLMKANYEQLLNEAYDQFEVALSSTQIILVRKGEDFREMRSRTDSAGHVLKPLGMQFMLRRCIASPEFSLPQFQLDGKLPLLGIDLTDDVLQNLVDIIAHVPLPEADPSQRFPADPDAILKDVKFFDSKTEGKMLNHLKAKQVLRIAGNVTETATPNTISREASDDEGSSEIFYDTHESLVSLKETKTKSLANVEIMNAKFVLEKVQIRLFETTKSINQLGSTAPILVLVVSDVGAEVNTRKYDQEIMAYVNRLALTAPRFTERGSDKEVCLIDTSRSTEENERLFTAHLMITDKANPDFATKHGNIRHNLVCEFRVLKLHLHQEALVSLTGFFIELAKVLDSGGGGGGLMERETRALGWADRLGDTEVADRLRESAVRAPRESALRRTKTTPVEAVTGVIARKSERRDIRVSAALQAEKMGLSAKIPEMESTQWKIQLTLDRVEVFFCSSEMQLMAFSMRGMRVDLRMTYLTTEVALALTDMCVSDLNEDSLYRQILWIEPGVNVFMVQTVIYNRGTKAPEDQYDPGKVDVAISLQFGKAHVILLYWFLRRVILFMESFQVATSYAVEKATQVKDAAKSQVKEVVSQPLPPRIALSVNLEAPMIYMPQNSQSRSAIVFDLGRIALSNHFDVIPKPSVPKDDSVKVLMMERMTVRLEDLKMSAALLVDGGTGVERNVVQPINLSLHMSRKVFPSSGDGVPIFDVSGSLETLRLSMTFGDYKLINEVFIDNFEEADSLLGPLSDLAVSTSVDNKRISVSTVDTVPKAEEASTLDSTESNWDKSASFNFILKQLEIELFLGTNTKDNWSEEIQESRRLGVFTCTELFVSGDTFTDNSSSMTALLKDVSLVDTRPHSEEYITKILSSSKDVSKGDMENFIEIFFRSDSQMNQTLDVNVCSILICASLDYFMTLAKFFTEGAPHSSRPPAQSGQKPAALKSKQSSSSGTPTLQNDRTLRIKTNIADPEIVLPEDMSNPDCNAILVTTSLCFDYTMLRDETVINASINMFRILACPFKRSRRNENSMEVVAPTSVYFYGRQPAGDSLHGTINLESLLISVNASIIRSISKIMAQLTEVTSDVSMVTRSAISTTARRTTLGESPSAGAADFWAVKPVTASDIPVPKGETDFEDSAAEVIEGVDVARVITKIEDDREEKILVRVEYVCLSMESQIGAKQVPILLMEAHVDGELKSPSTALEASFNFELAISYYNDHLNEWEQLLETLPEENNRLWSLQVEYSSEDPEPPGNRAKDKLEKLQNSGRSLRFISQDNLEITISKTALDVLSKLGKSFEEAYVSPKAVVRVHESLEIKAPYVLRNQTGLRLMVAVDGQRLRTSDNAPPTRSSPPRSALVPSQRATLVAHVIEPGQNIGLYDSMTNTSPTVRNLRSAPITPPRPINIGLAGKVGDCSDFASKTAALNIHRTANYMLFAISPDDFQEVKPVVASITAFLGQKTVYLQSTLQIVNQTPEAIRVHSLLARGTSSNENLLSLVPASGTYSLPVDIVTNKEITGIRICPDLDGATPSSDIIYWPPKASPLSAHCESREDTCIYLVPRSTDSEAGGGRGESEWVVQEVSCSLAPSNAAYNYTVTMEPRFPATGEERASLLLPPAMTGSGSSSVALTTAAQPVAYNMVVRAPASLHNHLPAPMHYELCGASSDIEPGHLAVLSSVKSSGFAVGISFTYNEKEYQGRISINPQTEEMSLLSCEAHDGYTVLFLNLGLRCSRRCGHIDLTVYCPYWLVNKTGLNLKYKTTVKWYQTKNRHKSQDPNEYEVEHPADFPGIFLFSVTSKSALLQHKSTIQQQQSSVGVPKSGKSTTEVASPQHRKSKHEPHLATKVKIVMKTEDSLWSNKFSLDTVGNWDRVHCEGTLGRSYEIGVKINLASSGLTKIVTFMPYFMIVNKTPLTIDCAQIRDEARKIRDTWIPVKAGDVRPFWPATGDNQKMLMTCRVDQKAVTGCFPLYESNTVLLKLPSPYIGLYTDVQTTDEATVINLQMYKEGMALVHIINDMEGREVNFYQKGTNVTHTLKEGQRVYYAWDDAIKPRQFFVYLNNPQKAKQIEVTTDSYDTFVSKDTNIYVVSFLSKLQRTLLFTTDPVVANLSAKSGELESVTDRVSVILQSIGISLVNNQLCKEACYISIRSSEVIWNKVKRGNRLKPLKAEMCEALEALYTSFLAKVEAGEELPRRVTLPESVKPTTSVDLSQMVMLEPDNCPLQRTFEPGVQLQYRASANQMQVHGKVFRLQVDSQQLDSTFPVVFAPFPQPVSVSVDSGPKALVEVFTVICKTPDDVYRFKRLECLIQEMQCQVDQGFLNNILDFFAGSVMVQDELLGFTNDVKLTSGALLDAPVVKDVLQPGRESIIDYIHISPIKMHVSFSLVGSSAEGQPSALHSDVLKLFLQSLGVALTDVQDVIFKLGYFERRGRIMSFSKVFSEMGRYYMGQAIKQAYVLILGLDVIGNPFGVIRGMAQGVEDLFYEPVKGAVVGSEEFAEGVALGVKSLFGHTVGGAAGAMSRIAGTLGKGVAALTMDDDYKRRRREEMTRQMDNFGAGMARSGKGLVMGVVGGVTGIFTQPIQGAKKDGVEGFFKGLGKGLIGTVARPVSGMVDFASTSFEGIRRATSTSKQVVPVRPPRFIHLDGVIRPYDRYESEGNVFLARLHQKTKTEEYVFHVPLKRNKGVCLLTNERVMILTINEILASCAVDWETPLSQLNGSPKQCDSGLELNLVKSAKKKLFGSSLAVKQVECTPDNATRMLMKIRLVTGESASTLQEAPQSLPDICEVD